MAGASHQQTAQLQECQRAPALIEPSCGTWSFRVADHPIHRANNNRESIRIYRSTFETLVPLSALRYDHPSLAGS